MLAIIKKNIFIQYFVWHFFDAARKIINAWRNFLLFNLHYFSISLLIRTLFSYWHKYRWSYGKRFDLKIYLETFFSNFLSRFIGMVIRIFFIVTGFLIEIFIFFFGLIILLIWFALPIILILGLYYGFKVLI